MTSLSVFEIAAISGDTYFGAEDGGQYVIQCVVKIFRVKYRKRNEHLLYLLVLGCALMCILLSAPMRALISGICKIKGLDKTSLIFDAMTVVRKICDSKLASSIVAEVV